MKPRVPFATTDEENREQWSENRSSSYLEPWSCQSKLKLRAIAIPLISSSNVNAKMTKLMRTENCALSFLSTFPFAGFVIIYRRNSVFNYCKVLELGKFLRITYVFIFWPYLLPEFYWNFNSREEVIEFFTESLFNYIWRQCIDFIIIPS